MLFAATDSRRENEKSSAQSELICFASEQAAGKWPPFFVAEISTHRIVRFNLSASFGIVGR